MKSSCIFTDFLAELGVPHTRDYSDSRFDQMTFRSLFGLSKLLESYGIPNEALQLADKEADLPRLTPPFIARVGNGFAIVREIRPGGCVVGYDSGGSMVMSHDDFMKAWSGVVLLAFPDHSSAEPNYCKHHLFEIADAAKKWVLAAACIFIFLFLFISNGIYSHPTLILLTLVNLAGLYVTYQLVLKSLNIHTGAADNICGLIDRHGCTAVLSTKASKFFGLFGWSEVGLSYFSISLGCLLIFPQYLPYLALINACCCPFSFWSVWYQKYRAKSWCTLCLITQACLWASLILYICGGWFRGAFSLRIEFFILGASYVAALLGINAIMPAFDKNPETPEE